VSKNDEPYRRLRPLAFAVAYRMLGSISEAEDVVQETLLRLHVASGREDIRSLDAFVTTLATRLSIDSLRSARVRRERYFGSWLPEPLVGSAPDVAEHAETADSLSMAFLVLLETLTPVERAAFLLREVFDYEYAEIAAVVGKSEVNCRQLVTRARARVDDGKPRFEASRRIRDELAARFFAACEEGDLPSLIDLLAADAVFTGDGGGKVPPGAAISQPVFGRDGVARLMATFARRLPGLRLSPTQVNGQPGALLVTPDGQLISVLSVDVAGGLIQGVRSIINPEKLHHLGPIADLAGLAEQARGRPAAHDNPEDNREDGPDVS
jgi:RNA polymerase sigma-70 factor (ECF subfamily)